MEIFILQILFVNFYLEIYYVFMFCFGVEKNFLNSNYIGIFISFSFFMKKIIYVLFVGLFFTILWCGRELTVETQEKDINEKIMTIQKMLVNWEITQEQAQEMTQNIGNYSLDDIAWTQKSINVPKITWLPDRAKHLWLTEAEWMVLDQEISKITSVDNKDEWFDSLIFVYQWDYDRAITQAARIANVASIPVSKEFQQAKEIEKNSPDVINQMWDDIKNSMKWVVYSNHDLTDTNIEYLISISVDEDWTLTINASNYHQMKEVMTTR